ncbi:MAG: epoxyqueuosine reductase QueH [Thermodesulfovibrionales bacterium]|nr:epoxyqueuosine reductase QueH [Thermodesulfovibrionales bacterium]
MKLLMHICCANCALYPLTVIKQRDIDVKGLWFNPNIHPLTEYKSRLDALKKLETLWNLNIEYVDYYGLKEYLRNVVGNEDNRCEYCYSVRLEETAKRARDINADAFTTSLLVSPYQKFDMIIDIGRMMQERYSVEFFIEDFRNGFNEGRRMSKELELYRQKYCGCIYSEMERYGRNSAHR